MVQPRAQRADNRHRPGHAAQARQARGAAWRWKNPLAGYNTIGSGDAAESNLGSRRAPTLRSDLDNGRNVTVAAESSILLFGTAATRSAVSARARISRPAELLATTA